MHSVYMNIWMYGSSKNYSVLISLLYAPDGLFEYYAPYKE